MTQFVCKWEHFDFEISLIRIFLFLRMELKNHNLAFRSKQMKTNGLYAFAMERHGNLFQSKIFVFALIIALVVAAFPGINALAAGNQTTITNAGLEDEWKSKLNHLRYQGLYFDTIRLYPADFDDLSDLAQAQFYLEKYGIALRQAQTVVLNHTGFDINGRVTNQVQAAETVRNLAMYLHMMRGLRDKIEEVPSRK